MAGTLAIGLIFLYSSVLISILANLISLTSNGILAIMQKAQTALDGWDIKSMYSLMTILIKYDMIYSV